MIYDVIVIGGGTSGLMAACAAAQVGAQVLLLEKNPSLGKKLLLTGGTRCNVTNKRPARYIIDHIPGNGKFLYSAFSRFDNSDIMAFFEERGVALKEEDHGRMFPVSDSAKTILQTFIDELKHLKVDIICQAKLKELEIQGDEVTVHLEDQRQFQGRTVVLAMGGRAHPRTGSTGDAYPILEGLGHTIQAIYPTEVPLTSSEPFIKKKRLHGLSLRDVKLTVLDAQEKPVVSHQMDMIFTHFGVSGPAVLRCSMFVQNLLRQGQQKTVHMKLDALPGRSKEELIQAYADLQADYKAKAIRNVLKEVVPERYAEFLCQRAKVPALTPCQDLSKKQWAALVHELKGFSFEVDGSLSIDKAFVTGGGLTLDEVDPYSMQSKFHPQVFICGELLDLNGYTSGYNITAAFVTGHAAGESAAYQAFSMA